MALLHPDSDLDIMLVCLRDRIGADNIYQHKIELLKDKDWVGEFKAEHQPLFFSDRVCISPSWCDQPDNTYLPTLVLDPGLAFGTGAHPTTSLCIEWLAENDLSQIRSSLIMAVAQEFWQWSPRYLGAREVYAVDIDESGSYRPRESNIDRNKLTDKIVSGLMLMIVALARRRRLGC